LKKGHVAPLASRNWLVFHHVAFFDQITAHWNLFLLSQQVRPVFEATEGTLTMKAGSLTVVGQISAMEAHQLLSHVHEHEVFVRTEGSSRSWTGVCDQGQDQNSIRPLTASWSVFPEIIMTPWSCKRDIFSVVTILDGDENG
jgi:hypothetical protein